MKKAVTPDVSRRNFLIIASASVGGGFMVSYAPGLARAEQEPPASPEAFIRIDRQGKVTIVSPMVEMGQGTYTSLPMLVAEELDVDIANVTVAHALPNDKLYGNSILGNSQVTGASTSIRAFFLPLRKIGGSARAMLLIAAAEKWGLKPDALKTEPGFVVDAGTNRYLSYGELADAAAKVAVPADIVLKDPSQFRLIGKPIKRLDVSGKVNGSATFGIDAKVPGMKIATVAASPVFGGKLLSFYEEAARNSPGVADVVPLENALAVIGEHYWAAKMGLEAAAPVFDEGPNSNVSSATVVAALSKASERNGVVAKNEGDAVKMLSTAARKLEATYEAPLLAHATMEPINCTVSVSEAGCDVWVGTQIPVICQQVVAKALNLKVEQVRIHNHLLGGGFGRRLEADFVLQAALIAKDVEHPVKVVWSREEDIQHDMYRPYYYDRIAAALDDKGMPVAWAHRIVGSSIFSRWAPSVVKNDVDPDAVDGAIDMPYAIENCRVEYVREEPPGIPTSFWRVSARHITSML